MKLALLIIICNLIFVLEGVNGIQGDCRLASSHFENFRTQTLDIHFRKNYMILSALILAVFPLLSISCTVFRVDDLDTIKGSFKTPTEDELFRAGVQLTHRQIMENSRLTSLRARCDRCKTKGRSLDDDWMLRTLCRKLMMRHMAKPGHVEEIVQRRMKIPAWREEYTRYFLMKQQQKLNRCVLEKEIDALAERLAKIK